MLTVAFFGSFLLWWLCYRQKRKLEARGHKEGAAHEFYWQTCKVVGILSLVLFLYNALLFLVTIGWQYVSVSFLLSLEQSLVKAQELFKRWNLTWTSELIILVALYLIGFIPLRLFQSDGRFKAFKKIKGIVNGVYTALIFLASFTLLGSEAGPPAATLELRLRTVRSEYGVLRQETGNTLAQKTAKALYIRLRDKIGPTYKNIPPALIIIDVKSASLREYYQHFRQEYDARDAAVERANEGAARREAANRDMRIRAKPEGKETAVAEAKPPPSTTYRSLEQAREGLGKYRDKVSPDVIELVERPGGKDIIAHLPTLFTDKISEFLTDPLTEEYPFLKPIVRIFSSSFNAGVESKIRDQIDGLTKSLAEQPGTADETIDHAANDLAARAPLEVSPREVELLARDLRALQHQAQEIDAMRAQLERRASNIEHNRVERLIGQLKADDDSVRERAAEQLSRMGDRLTREQVERLRESMRNGTQEWVTSEEREGHCTDYQYKSVRYYAGRALENMKSPYVSDETSAAAREAQETGTRSERITDPGWV